MRAKGRLKADTGRDVSAASSEMGDAVSYALGHRIRLDVLVALNEKEQSPAELSRRLGITMSKIQHHVDELAARASIELAEVRQGPGNVLEHVYRAVSRSQYSAGDMAGLDALGQRVVVGATLQNSFAEHLAAFREDAMRGDDPDLVLMWNWFHLDEEGRREVRAELEASWRRMQAIEARSTARSVEEGKEARSVVISSIAHPRVRPAPADRPPFGSRLY
ncbi:MAG: winged helix-turn-helix transcriptional regulator [Actinobacteria bacterium]|nr:winged helix-turn-helix transcriptional regulator [Actinomycetota bacterium]